MTRMSRREVFAEFDAAGCFVPDADYHTDGTLEQAFFMWCSAGRPRNRIIEIETCGRMWVAEPGAQEKVMHPVTPGCAECGKLPKLDSGFCSEPCAVAWAASHKDYPAHLQEPAPEAPPVVEAPKKRAKKVDPRQGSLF